jgi:serine/threonine protein kinase
VLADSIIAAGLEFLHKQKVLHRDVKPDNVLCTLDVHDEVQTLAIADFDTAKVVSRSSQAKTTIGTPSYMAPEVFSSNQQPYDYKADVWSFGMTIYELVRHMKNLII